MSSRRQAGQIAQVAGSTDFPGSLGADYAPDDDQRPLAGYSALSAAFGVTLAGAPASARVTGRELPERLNAQDLVLAGTATHKISRLLAKDKVTRFIRAPFTRFPEKSGKGELEAEPRGSGLRHAIGELLVCPYCLARWIAGAFAVGYVDAPRTTRLLAGLWTIHAIADGAQLAYSAAQQRT